MFKYEFSKGALEDSGVALLNYGRLKCSVIPGLSRVRKNGVDVLHHRCYSISVV
jgi:hypothetical protein